LRDVPTVVFIASTQHCHWNIHLVAQVTELFTYIVA